jgi:hypothetical protein
MTKAGLIFEAMICVVTEVFEVYGRICRGISRALVRVYAAPKGKKAEEDARMALGILRKAQDQGDNLSLFFDLCRGMGVIGSSSNPRIERIPDEDLRELERIINGVPKEITDNGNDEYERETAILGVNDDKEWVTGDSNKSELKTIVTDKWEIFEETNHGSYTGDDMNRDYALMIDVARPETPSKIVLPDLISF